MKRWLAAGCMFLMALFAASCGAAQPEKAAVQTVDVCGEPVYPISREITVSGGRILTLRLYGRPPSGDHPYYGISRMDVLEGERLLQSLVIREAIQTEWKGAADSGGYTEAYAADGGIRLEDMNFDGAEDIGLMAWMTAGANLPYYYWLWDEETEQFRYAFCLCNAKADAVSKLLITDTRESAALSWLDYYAYTEEGRLRHVRREPCFSG